jgi:hypothetical protein
MTGWMSTTSTAATALLQLVVEKEARQAAYRLHGSNHFKKSDILDHNLNLLNFENFVFPLR